MEEELISKDINIEVARLDITGIIIDSMKTIHKMKYSERILIIINGQEYIFNRNGDLIKKI